MGRFFNTLSLASDNHSSPLLPTLVFSSASKISGVNINPPKLARREGAFSEQLLKNNIVVLSYIQNLRQITKDRVTLMCFPLKMVGTARGSSSWLCLHWRF